GSSVRSPVSRRRRIARRPGRCQHPAFEGDRQPVRRHHHPGDDCRDAAAGRRRSYRQSAGLRRPAGCAPVARDRGIATAIYVASSIILFPRLGAVVTVGLFIAGQMLASLSLDTFGGLGVPRQSQQAVTLIGTLAVFAGAAAIVLGQKGATSELSVAKLGWILLALLAGAVLPVQGAINGLLRTDLRAPFVVGTTGFALPPPSRPGVLLVPAALADLPKPRLSGLAMMPWWGWLGAICGATYVTTVFTAIPVIGTAAAVGLTVAGQQIASLFVDRYGWLRLPRREISSLRFGGVVLLLAGVAAIHAY